jgi:hypothetical protein
VQKLLKRSIELYPTYAHAGAFRLLGVIQQKLPGILGGSNDRAREFFEKAIKTAPDEPLNYLFLATLLDEELDDPAGALAIARKGMAVEGLTPDRLEAFESKEKLAILIKKNASAQN